MAEREHDKLLLQDQDQIAAALNFTDADALMLAVSTAGRQIAWVSDDMWRRRRLWDPTGSQVPPTLPAQRRPRALRAAARWISAQIMIEIDGEIALSHVANVSEDASLALRLAATAAAHDRPIAKGITPPVGRPDVPPGDPWPPEVLPRWCGSSAPGGRHRQDRMLRLNVLASSCA